jgi:tripartite-type tricarboxylate transporter receptor subunit TctC
MADRRGVCAFGVTESRRSRLLPEVPTVAEAVPGYEMAVSYGALGPKDMPRGLVARLDAEINRALLLPEVRDKMAGIGVEVVNETPEPSAAVLRTDAQRWGKAIRDLGITTSDA